MIVLVGSVGDELAGADVGHGYTVEAHKVVKTGNCTFRLSVL